MKRLAGSTALVLVTLTAVFLVWQLSSAVVLFILSLVIAATIRPLIDWFAARGLPRALALLLAYVVCVGSIIALITVLGGSLLPELQQLTKDATSGYEQLIAQWPKGTSFQQSLAQRLPAASDLYATITGAQGGTLLQTALGFTLGSFDVLGQLLISLVISIYWSTDQEHFKRLWVSLLPVEMRARARDIWQNIELGMGGYLRSELIQSVLALILLGIGYHVLGLKYATALALIGTIGWLIPWVGVLLAVIPAVLVGLSMSPALGILTAVMTIAVLAFLEFVIEPRLFNRRNFSSLLVVIVVLVLLDQLGLIGILIAPPLAAVLQIFASQLFRSTIPAPTLQLTQPISALQERLSVIQSGLTAQPEATTPEITNLMARLTQLIARATDSSES
ncbi:MAG: AI-2E family transporter [Anaerolineae bacterium]|nr:AI-2E family transporter [Anaerolineae bacterium]